MAGVGEIACVCDRCGREVPYSHLRCFGRDLWLCPECYATVAGDSVVVEEDDGYED